MTSCMLLTCSNRLFFYLRPLFSSLLVALPVKKWHTRDDTYECTEAEYIPEVESDLFLLEGKLIIGAVLHLLETQTSLSVDKVQKVCTN